MTLKDFTSRELSRPYAGTLMEITTNASYVKLWAHRPRYNAAGVLQKPRGSVLTDRFPRNDYPGLYQAAQNGYFPWPVDAEPDLSAYPGNSKQFIDNRKEVLKAYEAYAERYGTETEPEPVAEEIPPEPEPVVELPEPIAELEPVEQIICAVDGCTYEPKSMNLRGKLLSLKVQRNSLRLHMKSHKQVATA